MRGAPPRIQPSFILFPWRRQQFVYRGLESGIGLSTDYLLRRLHLSIRPYKSEQKSRAAADPGLLAFSHALLYLFGLLSAIAAFLELLRIQIKRLRVLHSAVLANRRT